MRSKEFESRVGDWGNATAEALSSKKEIPHLFENSGGFQLVE